MCNLDKNLLYSYADGTIEELEKIFVEEHLKYCTQCVNSLEDIKAFDDELEGLNFDDIVIPDRLSLLSNLVAENCVSQLEKEQAGVQYSNYKEGMKKIRRVAIGGYKQIYENPYSRMVEERVDKCASSIKNTAKSFCKKRLAKSKMANSKIMKLLKVV